MSWPKLRRSGAAGAVLGLSALVAAAWTPQEGQDDAAAPEGVEASPVQEGGEAAQETEDPATGDRAEDPSQAEPAGGQEDAPVAPPEELEDDGDAAGAGEGAPAPADTAEGGDAAAEPPETTGTGPRPTPSRPVRPRYRFQGDRDALASAWLGSGLAERIDLGRSAGDRELFCVQFGRPGPTPLDQRTTVLLVGGLDGVSIAGGEAVIAVTDALLAAPDLLPPEATFVSIPWANPDGLARWLDSGCTDGRNDRSLDDDGDGAFDEDLPDDLDGDGVVLEMLIEDPDGPWAFGDDERFLRRAREGEAPRYLRTREGRDDDGDGRFNEDQAGGVVLDRNFPVNWRRGPGGALSGPWPLSEPTSRALAELALARRCAVVLLFQGNHGVLAGPGGLAPRAGRMELPLEGDRPAFEAVLGRFVSLTGREQSATPSLFEAYGRERPGAAVDWFYTALGALAVEVGVWGPDVDVDASDPMDALFQREAAEPPARDGAWRPTASDPPGPGPVQDEPDGELLRAPIDHRWSRWVDDRQGGLGFVPWQPFELGAGRRALVGGWQPYTCFNPPVEALPATLRGLDAFVRAVGDDLPKLDIELEEMGRDGRVAVLRAHVRNRGGLPSGVGPAGDRLGIRLRIELPQGVRLLSGERERRVGHLPARGRSEVFDWLLLAPADSVFQLVVESDWTPPVEKEVSL